MNDGGAIDALATFEHADAQLDRLREAAGTDVVIRLLETSCLLELAKLAPAKLDLASFPQTAVEIISQFIPISGCSVAIRAPGMVEVAAATGTIGAPTAFDLCLDGEPVGTLHVDGVPDFLLASSVFDRAAEQLSETLQAVVDSERLRRQAALAGAMRVAGAGDEPHTVPHLRLVVDGLLDFPPLLGMTLRLEGPAFAQPVTVEGGVLSGIEIAHDLEVPLAGGVPGRLQARTVWCVEPLDEDCAAVDAVLAELAASIDRVTRSRQLIEEAELDPLTGVGNRRRATRALASTLNLAGRSGQPAALLAIDLDHFKRINDTLGHPAGDQVLRALAHLFQSEARMYDVVARIGGDEFLIVCPATDTAGAKVLAERLRAATPDACAPIIGGRWRQTLSIGIAVAPRCGSEPEDLTRWADKALYEAKQLGRDGLVVALDDAR